MAGGIFENQTKVRPGAYLNFVSVDEPELYVGNRGIALVALPLDWGDSTQLIELYSEELLNEKSLAKVGLSAYDEKAKLLNLILSNAYKVLIYRLNNQGTKATASIGNLSIEARYQGIFGNSISVAVVASGNKFYVNTYVNGEIVDKQLASKVEDLKENKFVLFSGSGVLEANAGTALKNGASSEYTAATEYPKFLNMARVARWNTMAVPMDADVANPLVMDFIADMREKEGKYVQAVINTTDVVDTEGIINNVNGCVIDNVQITPIEFTAWVAGATAGADINMSNTGKVVEGATSITNPLDNEEIVVGLQEGKYILSLNQDGKVKVEKDINSLHTFTNTKNYAFSKNRVIRVLDEIGSGISNMWENTFIGKVSNDEDGRNIFKSSIITYLTGLQNVGALRDFNGSSDVQVVAGESIDSVEASIRIRPVDSMEFLYMTVSVDV